MTLTTSRPIWCGWLRTCYIFLEHVLFLRFPAKHINGVLLHALHTVHISTTGVNCGMHASWSQYLLTSARKQLFSYIFFSFSYWALTCNKNLFKKRWSYTAEQSLCLLISKLKAKYVKSTTSNHQKDIPQAQGTFFFNFYD